MDRDVVEYDDEIYNPIDDMRRRLEELERDDTREYPKLDREGIDSHAMRCALDDYKTYTGHAFPKEPTVEQKMYLERHAARLVEFIRGELMILDELELR